ncbi:hypothetical protein BD309DRAFT_852493 [Dichomitus squalens]|uniref:Uncharacterized protein n=1 Tax=Dichomitus squalens TaxID=114155 RepID=A0A4Q9P8B7_9APHY|nr:hypothetical protein BD311DRAFT_653768 [Dichomitus squalens]TBU49011.1 hypothetical protein BD309DRAFT_852493 [Dichomitus squalens]
MSAQSLLPAGMSIPGAEQLFIQTMRDTIMANSSTMAAVTLLMYDICLTFSQEVEFVWRARWTGTKILYLVVRYYGLRCELMTVYASFSSIPVAMFGRSGSTAIIMLLSEALFMLRLWSTYGRSVKGEHLCIICMQTALATGITEARKIRAMPRPSDLLIPGCFSFAHISLADTLPAWVVFCVVSVSYFALMLRKLVTSEAFKLDLSKARRNPLTRWSEVQRFSPLLFLLVRDGVAHFSM